MVAQKKKKKEINTTVLKENRSGTEKSVAEPPWVSAPSHATWLCLHRRWFISDSVLPLLHGL